MLADSLYNCKAIAFISWENYDKTSSWLWIRKRKIKWGRKTTRNTTHTLTHIFEDEEILRSKLRIKWLLLLCCNLTTTLKLLLDINNNICIYCSPGFSMRRELRNLKKVGSFGNNVVQFRKRVSVSWFWSISLSLALPVSVA